RAARILAEQVVRAVELILGADREAMCAHGHGEVLSQLECALVENVALRRSLRSCHERNGSRATVGAGYVPHRHLREESWNGTEVVRLGVVEQQLVEHPVREVAEELRNRTVRLAGELVRIRGERKIR